MPWRQTPSRKKKAVVFTTVTTNAYQDQINAGFSKVCEIFKVCIIESLKYILEFHTPELWLVVWHVGQTASWAGLGQWKLRYIPDFQPSVWRSGYARLGLFDFMRRRKDRLLPDKSNEFWLERLSDFDFISSYDYHKLDTYHWETSCSCWSATSTVSSSDSSSNW